MSQSLPLKEPKQLSLLWARTLKNVEFFEVSRNVVQTINLLNVDNNYLNKQKDDINQLLDLYHDVSYHKMNQRLRRINITKRFNECRDEITELVAGINYMLEGLKRSPFDNEVEAAKYVQISVNDAGGSLSNQGRLDVMMWGNNMSFYISDDPKLQKMIDVLNLNRYFDKVLALGTEMFDLYIKRGGSPGDKHVDKNVKDIRKDVYASLQKLVEAANFYVSYHENDDKYLSLNASLYNLFRTCNALSKRRTTIRNKKKLKLSEGDTQSQQMAHNEEESRGDNIQHQVLNKEQIQNQLAEDKTIATQARKQTAKELLEELWAKEDTLSIDEIVNSPYILEQFAVDPNEELFKLLQRVVEREVGHRSAI